MIGDMVIIGDEFFADALFSKNKQGLVSFWKIIRNNNNYTTVTGYFNNGEILNLKQFEATVTANTLRSVTEQVAFEMKAKTKQRINSGFKYLSDYAIHYDLELRSYVNVEGVILNLGKHLQLVMPIYKSDNKGNLKPMLAKKFKRSMKNYYPMFAQPKINGIRAMVRWGEYTIGKGMFQDTIRGAVFTSRDGKLYHLPHIAERFTKDMFVDKEGNEIVYDGELYIHNASLNFIRASVPMISDAGTLNKASGKTSMVQYWVFDIAIVSPQKNRLSTLHGKLFNHGLEDNQFDVIHSYPIVRVPNKVVVSDDDAIMYAEWCIEKGFEGAIVRHPEALYNFGTRGKDMMKIKKALHTECEVLDVVPKDREPETGVFILKNDINEEEFTCNPFGTFQERKAYLDDKEYYIGKKATVKYYERSGVKEVPYHANVETIRDYE